MKELESILAALGSSSGQPAALATLVCIEGSSYRRPGARMLVVPGRDRIGSISGGCLEEDVAERALRVMASGEPELVIYDTTNENDLVWGVGTGCRGVIQVLIERIEAERPTWVGQLSANVRARMRTGLSVGYGEAAGFVGTRLTSDLPEATRRGIFNESVDPSRSLVLFGAGEDARPLSRLAKELGWFVMVVDSRSALATRARFPEADTVIAAPSGTVDDHVELDERSFVVVMTHRYEDDLRILEILLARVTAYIGVVGSRQRTERILEQLREEGAKISDEALAALSAPAGLDIGATTPETIALSILAEIQCLATGRNAARLRERKSPIHAGVA